MLQLLGQKIRKPLAKKGTTETASTSSKLCHSNLCTVAVLVEWQGTWREGDRGDISGHLENIRSCASKNHLWKTMPIGRDGKTVILAENGQVFLKRKLEWMTTVFWCGEFEAELSQELAYGLVFYRIFSDYLEDEIDNMWTQFARDSR